MLDSDVAWLIRYFSNQRDLANSFDSYLKHILMGVTTEQSVGLRTRAMKSLTQIIEVDDSVLAISDVRRAVHARMTDPNAQVREATIELLGKFLMARRDLIDDYYQILLERIKDSGTSVRKRVIRIIRDFCEKVPNYPKAAEMLTRIVRRVSDEEGVRKLVLETFNALWLHLPGDSKQLCSKVDSLVSIVCACLREGGVDCVESVLSSLLITDDRISLIAAKQIVDSLVDKVIDLDSRMSAPDRAVDREIDENQESTDEQRTLNAAQKLEEMQQRMLACLTTLSLFSKVRPEMMVPHAETLEPYLSMKVRTQNEQSVLNQVIGMLERVLPLIEHPPTHFVAKIDAQLCHLASTAGMVIIKSAVSCAAALYNKSPRHRPALASPFLHYLKNMKAMKMKIEQTPDYMPPPTSLPLMQRSVYSLGLMTRFFDWDVILEGDDEVEKCTSNIILNFPQKVGVGVEEPEQPEKRRIRDNVFAILHFFARHQGDSLSQKALTALGHVCAEHAEYLQLTEMSALYHFLLKTTESAFLQLKIIVLRNLELFLTTQEQTMMKNNSEWQKSKDSQDLREMELAGSGLGSAVIQIYWSMVLAAYFSEETEVRLASLQVVWSTLSQGLVTPGASIAVLIAMSTDPLVTIRTKVDCLIRDIDSKYSGMVQTKAVLGVREAFRLQKLINGEKVVVRGIRPIEQSATANTAGRRLPMQHGTPKWSADGQALLDSLYQSLRGGRNQRRAVVSSMLRLFNESSREQLSLSEAIFIADNLAMFPYQVLDEPLYVIHTIDSIVALSGQSIINLFKAQLVQGASATQPAEDDDVLFDPDTLLRRLPDDKCVLYELMNSSQACFTLLYLKTFLMKLYALTDVKVQEYSPSEAVKVYEKSVSRRNVAMFFPDTGV